MQKSDLVLEKYWVTRSGYFRLATTVALGMGISYGKLLLCHGISEESEDKKITTRELNGRTVYDCFNNLFPCYCGSPALNLPPITINDSPHQDKRYRYPPDLLLAAISVASENSAGTLTTPSDSPQVIVLTSDDPDPHHAIKKDNPGHSRVERGYCSRRCDGKI